MLFADNTNIFYCRQDPNQLMEIVNSRLKKLLIWFQAIKYSIKFLVSCLLYLFKTKQNRPKNWVTFHLMILKWACSWELYFVNWTLILQILNTERNTEKKVSKSVGVTDEVYALIRLP